jgi:hypothetical protein
VPLSSCSLASVDTARADQRDGAAVERGLARRTQRLRVSHSCAQTLLVCSVGLHTSRWSHLSVWLLLALPPTQRRLQLFAFIAACSYCGRTRVAHSARLHLTHARSLRWPSLIRSWIPSFGFCTQLSIDQLHAQVRPLLTVFVCSAASQRCPGTARSALARVLLRRALISGCRPLVHACGCFPIRRLCACVSADCCLYRGRRRSNRTPLEVRKCTDCVAWLLVAGLLVWLAVRTQLKRCRSVGRIQSLAAYRYPESAARLTLCGFASFASL